MKIIIFDSSTIINLVMNGIEEILYKLKEGFDGKFVITREVKFETVDRPMNNQQFELGAIKVSKLIDDKILELPEAIGVNNEEIKNISLNILKKANHVFLARNAYMAIIHSGEASCLALSIIASKKGIKNVMAVDERTTRMLGEKPENLRKLFERKFHTSIKFNGGNNLGDISKIKFIRSSELVYIAWRKGIISMGNAKELEALLYATKFKGSAISYEEIEEVKRCRINC